MMFKSRDWWWPYQNIIPSILEVLHVWLWGMLWIIVLLEYPTYFQLHCLDWPFNISLSNFLIFGGIHSSFRTHNISCAPSCHTTPKHNGSTSMLHSWEGVILYRGFVLLYVVRCTLYVVRCIVFLWTARLVFAALFLQRFCSNLWVFLSISHTVSVWRSGVGNGKGPRCNQGETVKNVWTDRSGWAKRCQKTTSCSIVVKLMDLDPQGRWFDPWWGQDKICTAVGPLSKALNPTLLQGVRLLLSLINCKSLWIKASAKLHVKSENGSSVYSLGCLGELF